MENIYIISGVRTAIGDFGGTLKDMAPATLGKLVIAEAIKRAGIEGRDVQHVVMGQAIPSEPRDSYVARIAAVEAGVPIEAPALTVNRLCASGMQAIVSGAQMIALGEAEVVVSGGTEVMSKSPYVLTASRWGQKMGNMTAIDAMLGVLSDPFEGIHMGVTAENVATRYQVTREDQDALAVESHRRAALAQAEGRFDTQILPVELKTRKGVTEFKTDEHVRTDVSLDSMAKLRPAFEKEGSVTAGNASGLNDGAAAVVLASQAAVDAKGLKPMAKLIGWGYAGVEPSLMGIGPVKAVPIALRRAGLTLDDIDVIEANEAFASQSCAVARELGFDPDKVNPNGSGISLGHPVGASGAIITVKLLYELERTGGRYGLATMCVGGGQGIAIVVERVEP
ncbi:acetyl-CoA C-acyltransferase family protein [Sphingobium sp. AN641]|uniref:acetyl-CoA C-acyltransferase family protein n=1 Tax=Sphingobium sp. AN641 TaxID=3133443 RepID=UPI0030BD9A09